MLLKRRYEIHEGLCFASGDGGKYLCGVKYLLQGRECVIYSLGSAGDTSFEEILVDKASCKTHTFDHTLSEETQRSVRNTQGVDFHPVGIGSPSKAAGKCCAPGGLLIQPWNQTITGQDCAFASHLQAGSKRSCK